MVEWVKAKQLKLLFESARVRLWGLPYELVKGTVSKMQCELESLVVQRSAWRSQSPRELVSESP